jgi:hypothetical protein
LTLSLSCPLHLPRQYVVQATHQGEGEGKERGRRGEVNGSKPSLLVLVRLRKCGSLVKKSRGSEVWDVRFQDDWQTLLVRPVGRAQNSQE